MNDYEQNISEHLMIFDGHAVAFYSWFTSEPNRVQPGFFSLFERAINKYNPDHVVVAFDPPPPTFRHLIYPAYKAQRPPVPAALLEGCETVRRELDSQGIRYITVPGYEADDVIGTLSKQAENSGMQTTIVTSDLDLLQLVSPSVQVEVFSQYWPTRFFDVARTIQHFNGIGPIRIPDYKALVGDSSDNLPGVRGIGETSAYPLLKKYGDLEGIYADLESVVDLPIRGAKRVQNLLRENQEEAFTMKTLTTIVCDGAIEKSCQLVEIL